MSETLLSMLRLSTCYMRRHEPSSHELLCEKGALKVMEAALHSAWRGSAPGMDDVRVQRAFEMQPWSSLPQNLSYPRKARAWPVLRMERGRQWSMIWRGRTID